MQNDYSYEYLVTISLLISYYLFFLLIEFDCVKKEAFYLLIGINRYYNNCKHDLTKYQFIDHYYAYNNAFLFIFPLKKC